MAVEAPTSPRLLLMAPRDGAPAEPAVYASPARPHAQKEVMRVRRQSSHEYLTQQASEASASASNASDDASEEGGDEHHTRSWKKSDYMTEEVEEKLGLAGADPYGLLELADKRWRATADELKKAYRKLVLAHHPDRKQADKEAAKEADRIKNGGGDDDAPAAKENGAEKKEGDDAPTENGEGEGEGEEEDDEFKMLANAWELLGTPEKRRQFDSVDYFDDHLPSAYRPRPEKGPSYFFRVFAGAFKRQAKFSEVTPVPLLGDEDTPYADVAQFYRFWQGFRSWRDFGLLAEHELGQAEDREERRWMQRQNKNIVARIKKDEMQRIGQFVALAYEFDPRVKAHKEGQARKKAEAKEEKERAAREEEEAKRAAAEAAAAAAKAAAQEAERAKQAGADEKAASKREKEKLRSALKKARKDLKALADDGAPLAGRASELDALAAALEIAELTALTATLAAGGDAADAALGAALEKVGLNK